MRTAALKYICRRRSATSWLADQGLIERPSYGDLRDVISRRPRDLVGVAPDDALRSAYARMRMYDVLHLAPRAGRRRDSSASSTSRICSSLRSALAGDRAFAHPSARDVS